MKRAQVILFITFVVLLVGCKKDKHEEIRDGDYLTADELAFVDALPRATNFQPDNILLPNGEVLKDFMQTVDLDYYNNWSRVNGPQTFENLGPQDARNALIGRLTLTAWNLTDRSLHQYPDEGTGKPAQNGIGYSWDGKDYNVREAPPGAGTICKEQIHGLDCSGFIYQLFLSAGVTIPVGTADTQRQPKVLEDAIKKSIPSLKKVKVEDLGQLSIDKIENGDIIYWSDGNSVFHIGMVLKKNTGDLAVFMSAGTKGVNQTECDNNLSPSHGPIAVQLTNTYWFGTKYTYGIVRINAELSGHWEFHARCQGQPTDAIVLNLQFPVTDSATFALSQNFTDYDGSPNTSAFNFLYDKTTNILSCTFIITDGWIPGFERKDHFSVKLNHDNTGYFNGINDYINNGTGCNFELLLINLE